MVPIFNLWGVADDQVRDIRRFLKERRIPYFITPGPINQRFLFVREKDQGRAQAAVKEEFAAFALARREVWQREWQEIYGGSYWRWLTRRSWGRATMAGLSALWFLGG